jgi:hypothetical protein
MTKNMMAQGAKSRSDRELQTPVLLGLPLRTPQAQPTDQQTAHGTTDRPRLATADRSRQRPGKQSQQEEDA